MQAVVIARIMLPYLMSGDEQQRKIYVKTMTTIFYKKRYWGRDKTGI